MATYIILSKFPPNAFTDPKDLLQMARTVSERIKAECPRVVWKESFATLGTFDVLDIVEADDPKHIEKATMIIRAYGHATTETLSGTRWKEFLEVL